MSDQDNALLNSFSFRNTQAGRIFMFRHAAQMGNIGTLLHTQAQQSPDEKLIFMNINSDFDVEIYDVYHHDDLDLEIPELEEI